MSDHAHASAILEPGSWDRVGGRPAAWTFVVFFLAWMMLVFTVWTTWPGQDHGTRMADSNILNAAKNYDAGGLWNRHGVPQLETYEDAERRPVLYGTYPPGPYWVHALLRRAGLRELAELRGASVVGSVLAGLLGLAAFSVLARSWLVGALAAAFYCFSAPFSGYADSVHMNVWMQIGLFWFLLCWVGFERARGPWRWVLLGLAAAAYLFEIWMTLEHIVLIALVVAARTIVSRRWSVWIGGAILAAVSVVGMASRVWHLTFEFGTVDEAMNYLMGKYEHRSGEGGGAGGGGGNGVGFMEVLRPWLGQLYWTEAGDGSRRREFGYPLLDRGVLGVGLGLVMTMLLARVPGLWNALSRARGQAAEVARSLGRAGSAQKLGARDVLDALADSRVPSLRAARAGLGWGVLLFVASLHWHIGMRQHALIHPHVILNMLPGMALILGSLVAGGWRLAMPDARGTGPVRWAGVPLGVALLAAFGMHLRHSAVLNRVFTLNGQMRQEILARGDADQWWRDLGAALRHRYGPVRRVVLYHWGPRQANLMALPHQYVEGGRMPSALAGPPAPGGVGPAIVEASQVGTEVGAGGATAGGSEPTPADLLMVEFPRRAKTPRVILEEGFDRFGFPEFSDEGPESTALFFSSSRWAGASAGVACDVRFAGGLRIERVRLSETIEGDAWALCFLVRGPNAGAFTPANGGAEAAAANTEVDQSEVGGESVPPQAVLPTGVPRATMAALVKSFDSTGERRGVYAPRLASRATYRNRSLVWVIIDKSRLFDGGELRIALTPRAREGRVEIERGRILPPGMSVDLDADEIVWKVELP